MGDGYRLICQLYPDEIRTLDLGDGLMLRLSDKGAELWRTGGGDTWLHEQAATLTELLARVEPRASMLVVCRHCRRELFMQLTANGWQYECEEHGIAGWGVDLGTLDLGLVRKDAAGRQDYQLFAETFATLDSGSLDFGMMRDGHWYRGQGQDAADATFAADADLPTLAAQGIIEEDPGPPPGLFAPWLLDEINKADNDG